MEVKNIEKYFSFEILRRGYDYYKNGKVKEINITEDGFDAIVSGSEQYTVNININPNDYEMDCTCPYSEEANCKHMSAVLYCLKNDSIPVNKSKVNINIEDITNFEKFKREFKKECYKLFHNRSYLHENELDDYMDIVNNFIKQGTKYISVDIELAYEIFEFFIMEIDSVDVYEQYGEKEDLFENLFKSFKKIFDNEEIFVRFLSFVGTIYTIDSDEYYFEHKENILNLLYRYIEYKWQAENYLILLNKMNNDNRIYDYKKRNIKEKIIYINYYFIDREKALELAEHCLDINEICEFLLNLYKDNEEKKIELLEKMIDANKGYSNEKYILKLIGIYKNKDKNKYLDLLDRHFQEHRSIEIYKEIKNNYSKEQWDRIKKQYLNNLKNSKLYIDICVEEGDYDELLKSLEDAWIETINNYINLLVHHKPKELLELYKNKLITEIDRSSCRQHYQKILINFNNMIKIPHGKDELKNIITYIRENYKNRKALQEEVDFYEETYL